MGKGEARIAAGTGMGHMLLAPLELCVLSCACVDVHVQTMACAPRALLPFVMVRRGCYAPPPQAVMRKSCVAGLKRWAGRIKPGSCLPALDGGI